MDVRTCKLDLSRTNSYNPNRPSEGKAEPTHAINKYFRQNSMFRVTNDDPDYTSNTVTDRPCTHSHQWFKSGDYDDVLTPEFVSNTKSSQTDFHSNETLLAQRVCEFDPLFIDFNENHKTQCKLNYPDILTLTTIVEAEEDHDFTDNISEADKGVLVNLSEDSLDSTCDGSQYTDQDLLEVLQSLEESMDGNDEPPVAESVELLSPFLEGCRQSNHRLVYASDDSSDDEDDTFVKVPNNILKDNQLSNLCIHQRSRIVASDVRRVNKTRWSDGFLKKIVPRKGQKKENSSPYSLATKFTPSGQLISNILPNKDGSMWITFQNSNVIKLYDYHGNAIDSVDLRMSIDDVTSSRDGNLYISCPKSRRIKVLTRTLQLYTLVVTPAVVRGITVSPVDSCLIACMVPDLTNQPEQDCGCHSACVIRYSMREHCLACSRKTDSDRFQHSGSKVKDRSNNKRSSSTRCICSRDVYCVKGSKVTKENLFKYPFRVAVNSNGDIAVSDHGNRTVLLLSDAGSLLGRFNQSNLRLLPNHALSYDVNNDLIIVQSGRRNILRIRSHYDGSTTVNKSTVTELESQIVTAAAIDSEGRLLVVTGRTLIKVLKKTH